MKKAIFSMALLCFSAIASAQFDASNLSASLSGNYSMYKGEFQQKTPGVKFELGYSTSEKIRIGLGYTYAMKIKIPSEVTVNDGTTTTTVESDFVFKFSTIGLSGNYSLINTEEDPFSVNGIVGASFVSASGEEVPRSKLPPGSNDMAEKQKFNGLTMDLGLGLQYNFGPLRAFVDGAVHFPANKVGERYVENAIPMHLVANVGIRIPFGQRDYE